MSDLWYRPRLGNSSIIDYPIKSLRYVMYVHKEVNVNKPVNTYNGNLEVREEEGAVLKKKHRKKKNIKSKKKRHPVVSSYTTRDRPFSVKI